MQFNHITPLQSNGKRLFYRNDFQPKNGLVGGIYVGPTYVAPPTNSNRGLFRIMDIHNVILQLRLYRWFWKNFKTLEANKARVFGQKMSKDLLMRMWCQDHPQITKSRVGRLIRMLVQYETNCQRNPNKMIPRTVMQWRWSHPLEFVYALENLMVWWLPRVIIADGGSCSTSEEFQEELDIIKNHTDEDDNQLVEIILRHRLK